MLDQDGDAPIHKTVYGHVDAVEAGSEIDIANATGLQVYYSAIYILFPHMKWCVACICYINLAARE